MKKNGILGFYKDSKESEKKNKTQYFKKLDSFQHRRREIVDLYNDAFKSIEWLKIPYEEGHCNSNFHLYVL